MEWFTAAEKFTTALSSSDPTPGGGAAAAHTGAMGCALTMMSVATTLKRKNLSPEATSHLEKSLRKLTALKTRLETYVQKDAEAYSAYLTARRLPSENSFRAQALQESLIFAATVPTDTASTAVEVIKELEQITPDIAPVIMSDIFCAKHLLQACIRCAIENIRANTAFIQNEDRKIAFEKQITSFLKSC